MKINKNKLAVAMTKSGLDFSKLALKAGVSRQTISYINNGKTCTPTTAKKIADALGVDVTEIIE